MSECQKLCGNCVYRGDEIIKYGDDTVDYQDIPTGFFQCQEIKLSSPNYFEAGEQAVVQDGSGYYGRLCVENDFGCLKWKGRDEGSSEVTAVVARRYRDKHGNRACAIDFRKNEVCMFYGIKGIATECCMVTGESLKRRGEDGLGTLIPIEKCILWKD